METHGTRGGALTLLQVALPAAVGWRLVVAAVLIHLLIRLGFGVHTSDEAMLNSSTAGSRALTPGSRQPLSTRLDVAGLDAAGLQLSAASILLWTGNHPLLLTSSTHLRALAPGGAVPLQAGLQVAGHLALWSGGHGSAVERSQRPLIPQVETLNVSECDAAFTVPGALTPPSNPPGGAGPQVTPLGRGGSLVRITVRL